MSRNEKNHSFLKNFWQIRNHFFRPYAEYCSKTGFPEDGLKNICKKTARIVLFFCMVNLKIPIKADHKTSFIIKNATVIQAPLHSIYFCL